jgi:lysophospholipase L1-like esterase
MTTAYVDQATGVSGASGTQASPYATIKAALAALETADQPGTSVIEGTYDTIAPITLSSADSGDMIEGGTIVALTAAEAIDLNGASNVTVTQTTIGAADGDAVLVSGGSGDTVSYSVISQAGIAGVEIDNEAASTTVTGNTILNIGAYDPSLTNGGAVYVHGASDTNIIDNMVYDAAGAGVSLASVQGATVTGNAVLDTGVSGAASAAIYVAGGNAAVTGNTVSGLGAASNAIELNGGNNTTVYDNTFNMASDRSAVILLQASGTAFANTAIQQNTVTSNALSPAGAVDYTGTAPLPTSLAISDNMLPSGYPLGSLVYTKPKMTAAAFMDTEGVNVTGGTQSYYLSQNIEDVEYLGITNVRLSVDDPNQYGFAAITDATADGGGSVQEYSDAGIRLDIIDGTLNGVVNPSYQLTLYNELQAAHPGAINSIEGLNQINAYPVPAFGGYTDDNGPDELAAAEAYQSYIYGQITSDPTLAGVGVVGFTGFDTDNFDGTATNIAGSSEVAAGAATQDVTQIYPDNGLAAPDTVTLADAFSDLTSAQLAAEATDGQLVVTEEGFQTTLPAETQADDYLDAFLQNAQEGIAKTYVSSVDDGGPSVPDGTYDNLFETWDATQPTQAATAIHDMNAILAYGETGTVPNPTGVVYAVAGEMTGASDMAVTETNGDTAILLWNEGTTPLNEDVLLATAANVAVFDPVTGESLLAGYADVGALPITLGSDPLILQVQPIAPATVTIPAGSGPDTLVITLSDTTTTAQSINLLIAEGSSFVPGIGGTYALAAGTSENLEFSGTFDVDGSQPYAVLYGYNADDIALTSLTNDGFTNPGQALLGGTYYVQDFGQPSAAPITVGSGPDEIVITLTGADALTQYEVQLDAAAGSPAIDFGRLETSATGSVSQQVTIFGSFTAGEAPQVQIRDLQGLTGKLDTGNESLEDPNSGVIVQRISYEGATVTPGATITAAKFEQDFTISPANNSVQPASEYAAPLAGISNALVVDDYSNPAAELSGFLTSYEDGNAKIVFLGDSTTAGVGTASDSQLTAGSVPDEFNYWLNQDGVGSQIASVDGDNNLYFTTLAANPTVEIMGQTTLSGGATDNFANSISGRTFLLSGQGSAISFTPDDPIYANQIEVQILGSGADAVQVAANGTVVGTLAASSDQLFDNDTINLAQGETITNVTLTQESSGSQYIEGIQTNNTASNAIKVINAGLAGDTATGTNYQEAAEDFSAGASGVVPNIIAQDPSLVFINLGINDMNFGAQTGETIAAFIAAEGSIVADLQSHGISVVLESPTPFTDAQGASNEAALVTAIGSLAAADSIPFLDLNTMFGGGSSANITTLKNEGFFSTYDGDPHWSAGGYALVGQAQANFIANLVKTYG